MSIPLKRRGELRVEVAETTPSRNDLSEALTRSLTELVEVFDQARTRAFAQGGPSSLEVECVIGTDLSGGLVVRDGGAGLFRIRLTWDGQTGPPKRPAATGLTELPRP